MRNKGKMFIALMLTAATIMAALMAVCLYWAGRQDEWEITYYDVEIPDAPENFKIALVSDLHLKEYGTDNCDLLAAIKNENPDIIAVTGDLLLSSSKPVDYTPGYNFLNNAAEIAPTYFSMGNHEEAIVAKDKTVLTELNNTKATVLDNQYVTFSYNGIPICLAGIYSLNRYDTVAAKEIMDQYMHEDGIKIVMCHHPDAFDRRLGDYKADLVLAGDAHGGQIRIPGIGGLYSHEGFFPKYTEGVVMCGQSLEVISRGLSNGNHSFPRINNIPELVIITVNGN